MKLQNNKGFTLIELLVVITIIGILATGATATYTSQIQKSRDTTRINDIKALQSGVEQVYQDRGEFPTETPWRTTAGSFWREVAVYVEKFPADPKSWQTCNKWTIAGTPCDYYYDVSLDRNGVINQIYRLSTWFENTWNVNSKAVTDGWVNVARLEIWVAIWNWNWQVWADDASFNVASVRSAAAIASCAAEFWKLVIKWNCR